MLNLCINSTLHMPRKLCLHNGNLDKSRTWSCPFLRINIYKIAKFRLLFTTTIFSLFHGLKARFDFLIKCNKSSMHFQAKLCQKVFQACQTLPRHFPTVPKVIIQITIISIYVFTMFLCNTIILAFIVSILLIQEDALSPFKGHS